MKSAAVAAVAAALSLLSLPAGADPVLQAPQGSVYGVFVMGITGGGEDLAEIQFNNGDSDEVDAGGLILMGAGIGFEPRNSPLMWQATINYHFDSVEASNGDSSFERFPLELMAFIKAARNHRFGFGLSYHMNPELDINIDNFPHLTVEFDDALGGVLAYDYRIAEQMWLGLRYTDIEYEPSDFNADPVDGSHWGLMFHLQFGGQYTNRW